MTTYIIQKGGSGHKSGIHYYERLTRCPRQARLGEEANLVSEHDISPNPAFQTGTLYHALVELYYRGTKSLGAVQFTTDDGTEITPDAKCLAEAQRLFRAYRSTFNRSELGQPVSIEEKFPQNEDQKKAILDTLGVPQLTIMPDMVTKITQPQLVGLENPPEGGLVAGYYLVDHKTAARRTDKRILERQLSLQFAVYQAVWNAIFPEKTLSGCLVRVAYKQKVPIFETIYIEPVDSVGLEVVRNFFAGALHMLESMPDWANGSVCKGQWGPCGFLETCGRY